MAIDHNHDVNQNQNEAFAQDLMKILKPKKTIVKSLQRNPIHMIVIKSRRLLFMKMILLLLEKAPNSSPKGFTIIILLFLILYKLIVLSLIFLLIIKIFLAKLTKMLCLRRMKKQKITNLDRGCR